MLAAHVIFGAYGFWLPNDPRGSWSTFVGSWELFRYGGSATKTTAVQSLAHRKHDHGQRLAAKALLKRPAVKFTGHQAKAIGQGFQRYAAQSELRTLACAILPDHVHLVLARHRHAPKQLAIQLKGAATRRLVEVGLHPFATDNRPPPCFARGEWTVYLDTVDDIHRAIKYVEDNPLKEGLPRQTWPFVMPLEE